MGAGAAVAMMGVSIVACVIAASVLVVSAQEAPPAESSRVSEAAGGVSAQEAPPAESSRVSDTAGGVSAQEAPPAESSRVSDTAGGQRGKRLLAFVNGYPGAGKTTICGLLSRFNITVKDLDDFTQPIVNRGHPSANTPEGIDRANRFAAHAAGLTLYDRQASFLKKEISDYFEQLPDDAVVVFCGIIRESVIPESMRGTKTYWLQPSPISSAMRSGIRSVLTNKKYITDCSTFEDIYLQEYRQRYEFNRSYATRGVADMSTPDIISEILASAGVGDDGIREAVRMFESIPDEKDELARLAREFECDEDRVNRLVSMTP